MNRRELIRILAERTDLTQARAADVVNALFDATDGIIPQKLRAGEKVQIPGFGAFTRKDREARAGRNPRTGAEITIAASSAPAFKAGRGLRDAILGRAPKPRPVAPKREPATSVRGGPRKAAKAGRHITRSSGRGGGSSNR